MSPSIQLLCLIGLFSSTLPVVSKDMVWVGVRHWGNSCVFAWCLYGCSKATQFCVYIGVDLTIVRNAAGLGIWCSLKEKYRLTIYVILSVYVYWMKKKKDKTSALDRIKLMQVYFIIFIKHTEHTRITNQDQLQSIPISGMGKKWGEGMLMVARH